MAICEIVRMGDPRINQLSKPVTDFDTPALKQLLQDMQDTKEALGGVGLAAPQIGVALRVIIYGFDHSSRYPKEKPVPPTTLINPQITPLSEQKISDWEGCLSVPGLRGLVPRYQHIHYQGYDEQGNRVAGEAKGFVARMLQHEVDHLDGILFPYRIEDLTQFGFEDLLWERIKNYTPAT